eukprot:COSAG02_NODE_32096_length_522_cov_1.078014_1_plen_53_part_00
MKSIEIRLFKTSLLGPRRLAAARTQAFIYRSFGTNGTSHTQGTLQKNQDKLK